MPCAERLAALPLEPHDRRQELLCGDESVPRLGRLEARVAVAARRRMLRRSSRAGSGGGIRPSRTAPASRRGAGRGGSCTTARPATGRSCGAAARRRRGRRPSRRRRARRRDRRGRSPGSTPRRTSAGRCGRRSARRACRCPCRRRSWRPSPRRRRGGSGTGWRRERMRRARRGTAAHRCPACAGSRRSARRSCGSARTRCPAERSGWARMNASSCLRGSTLGSMRYWMFGRSKLATKCCASVSRRRSVISRCVASVAVAVRATRGTPGNCSPRSPRVR